MARSPKTPLLPFETPDDLRSEEDVKIKFLLPFLESKGYKRECIDFNKPIEVQEGRKVKTIYADAVVYTTKAKTAPLIVCETKPATDPLTRADKEQTISYARLLPRIAPLALLTNGSMLQVFQTVSKNRIAELPRRKDLKDDFVKFVLSTEIQEALRTEAKHELFIIDDVQSFKRILKTCHDEIRNNEGYDPTEAFDQMAKVLFCKMHEEREHPDEKNRFRTLVYDNSIETLGVNVVKQIWEETKKDKRFKELFSPDSEITLHDRTIRKIVAMFESYDLSLTAFDVKGEAFEYFLGETFTGGLGQYFTPRNVVEFMVDAVDPKIGQKIIDPFCGTGGFLIYAFEVVSEKIRLQEFSDDEKAKWKVELSNRCIFGTDWAERTTIACKMNMIVHGDGSSGIVKHHGLQDIPGKIAEGEFDLCITNPPFGSFENDPKILRHYDVSSGRKSQDRVILAIERGLRLVKPGGMVSIVVIDGILNNDRTEGIRTYIRQNAWVRGIVSLPAVTFEGYHARAKTSILFLEKKTALDDEGAQENTFMSVVENSGYAANGSPIAGNELPEVLLDFRAFLRGKDSRVHRNSWATKLSGRMDAEYYWIRNSLPAMNADTVGTLAQSVADQLTSVTDELAKVQTAMIPAFKDVETEDCELGTIFEPVHRIVRLNRDSNYMLLGVKWWGAGTFIRENKIGKNIKAKRLNQVKSGWLVYNRLFARKGSFAIVPNEHEDGFVSGEFPTFQIKPERKGTEQDKKLLLAYVVHCLNSPQYLAGVDRDSTGSTKTSRGRFKENRFLAMRVAIPKSAGRMKTIVELLDKSVNLRDLQSIISDRLKALNDGIAQMLPLGAPGLPITTLAKKKKVVASPRKLKSKRATKAKN